MVTAVITSSVISTKTTFGNCLAGGVTHYFVVHVSIYGEHVQFSLEQISRGFHEMKDVNVYSDWGFDFRVYFA